MSFPVLGPALKSLLKKPFTYRYPSQPATVSPATRAKLLFDRDKCIHCSLCAQVCPTQACTFSQKTKWPSFDRNICIGCGLCAQACPKQAIELSGDFHMAAADKNSNIIITK